MPPAAVPAQSFAAHSRRVAADQRHRQLVQRSLRGYLAKRDETMVRFQDWQAARQAAAEVKWEAVNHLDRYLPEFVARIEARGTKVFWAGDAAQARDYVLELIRAKGARRIVKSKTMTGEEIHLGAALEAAGYQVLESDLGEFIVQLRRETPYHIVFPAMHLTKEEISTLFVEKLGAAPTNSAEELTMTARRVMRQGYCAADLGITGANFAVAETGMISITENEGNARLGFSLPKVHVAILGIEKVIPRLSDLALLLPMLATAGTGQPLTCYNSMVGGPRQPGETDGPEEFHVILVDNRRTELLADPEQRDALSCIRCGACLNICPVYGAIGGHAYGTTYPGPIGAVITPHLRGLQDWKHLAHASSLCGACTSVCPVRIDLHHHLLHHRRNAVQGGPAARQPARDGAGAGAGAGGGLAEGVGGGGGAWPGDDDAAARVDWERLGWRAFSWLMQRPALYRWAGRVGGWLQPLHGLVLGSELDPLRGWTATRGLPRVAARSFKDRWRERRGRRPEAAAAVAAQNSRPASDAFPT